MAELLQYPTILKTVNVPYIQFHAIDWKVFGKNRDQTAKVNKVRRGTVTLPMPNNGIVDSQSTKWEEAEGLLLGAGVGAVARNVINKVKDTAGDLLKGGEFVKGVTINDYASSHYEGTEFREFTFEFTMIPNNESEANNIINIIKFLKKHSLGTLTDVKKVGALGTLGLKYPAYWEIDIVFPRNARSKMLDLIKFKELVMTNVTHSEFQDISTVFKSGHPIKVDVSVSFKELEKMYSTDYE
jgi:hypothetical protein